MKVTLNRQEMEFAEGGYKYVFIKPYNRFVEDTVDRGNGRKMHLEVYDNGVEIRTMIDENEVATIINRDVAIDTKNHRIYILEADTRWRQNEDGSVDIIGD
ncbi:MAG: hypothetical protein Q4B48_08060 [Syntrophomonadaceae bacterium]|nr:hypothetical protein [Syntrophomonadaceae bacterium]